jgi:hypothetical protein
VAAPESPSALGVLLAERAVEAPAVPSDAPPLAAVISDASMIELGVVLREALRDAVPMPETPQIVFPVDEMREIVREEVSAVVRAMPQPAPEPGLMQRMVAAVLPSSSAEPSDSAGQSCVNCGCFRKGHCRRGAPIVVLRGDTAHSEWPKVKGSDWCGEWRA